MKAMDIVVKEMFQRTSQLMASMIAIILGIAIIVAIKNITFFSEKAVARELDSLGANILILPKSANVQNYYSADFQDEVIPEKYVDTLVNSSLQGLDNLSPKLSIKSKIRETPIILTGILPKSEFRSKAAWQGTLGVFSRPEGCGTVPAIPGVTDAKETLVRKRVIEDLSDTSILMGASIASKLKLSEGDRVDISGKTFKIEAVLPQTGTVDDARVFAHLKVVQQISGKKDGINVIEIVGCCSAISGGLIQKLNNLLPDARVVTISQIVQTQISTNGIMNKLSSLLLVVIVLIGGAGIANYMYSNVHERRKEIGILMALGAMPSWIVKMFMLKASIIGLIGGIAGYAAGTAMAVTLGPAMAGIPVFPMPQLIAYSMVISIAITLIGSLPPAYRATRVDPYVIMREE